MNCIDCKEAVIESERRVAVQCHRCHAPLHVECAMVNGQAHNLCEPCFFKGDPEFVKLMATPQPHCHHRISYTRRSDSGRKHPTALDLEPEPEGLV